ncbi:MAG: diguanylate cyclase [Burkholderiales bacterium]|nr:diguanylate cyclase [Burkholderiales bacterium]
MPNHYSDISEENYRYYYLKQDRAQCRRVIRVAMWAVLPLAFVDFSFHAAGLLRDGLMAARVVELLYSWWLLRQVSGKESSEALAQPMLRWIVMVLLVQLASNASLPRDYFGHYMVDIWLGLMAFIVIPLPLRVMRPPLIAFVAFSLVLLLYKQPPVFAYAVSAALMLPAGAVTGHAIAAYVHRCRRKILSAERELERQASIDPVTGVANRREFIRISDAELQRHLRAGKPLSVLVLDLDQLEQINDAHGPQAGDIVLVEVSRRMKRAMRNYDSLARYSIDEFCILLPEATADDADKIADRTRATVVAMPVSVSGKELKVTARIGIATMREGDTAITLLQRADAARGKKNDAAAPDAEQPQPPTP